MMAKEEDFLADMEKLEIEPQKVHTVNRDENPFIALRTTRRLAAARCSCSKKSIRNTTMFKRSNHKLLKEPILKLEGKAVLSAAKPFLRFPIECKESPNRCPLQTLNLETLNVCALVEDEPPLPVFPAAHYRESQSTNDVTTPTANTSSGDRNRSPGSSCSQQALNPQCDITIDELASYFETLVHIPKKMSTMAEMMYI